MGLAFSLVPLVVIPLVTLIPMWTGSLLFALLCPIIGAIVGVVAMTRPGGLKPVGRVLSIGAIALPTAFVALIIFWFVGAMTGLISLM